MKSRVLYTLTEIMIRKKSCPFRFVYFGEGDRDYTTDIIPLEKRTFRKIGQ